ncbi:MAG: InlB B-repeat-containing protein, partial [Coriobacteriales bacterium]|nr:InlB B-repeat-containing protein [Coriobacteriales bacterium]
METVAALTQTTIEFAKAPVGLSANTGDVLGFLLIALAFLTLLAGAASSYFARNWAYAGKHLVQSRPTSKKLLLFTMLFATLFLTAGIITLSITAANADVQAGAPDSVKAYVYDDGTIKIEDGYLKNESEDPIIPSEVTLDPGHGIPSDSSLNLKAQIEGETHVDDKVASIYTPNPIEFAVDEQKAVSYDISGLDADEALTFADNGAQLHFSVKVEEAKERTNVILKAGEGVFSDGSHTKEIRVPIEEPFGDALETPTRQGYIFDVWKDQDGNVVTSDTIVTKNINELEAFWHAVTFTVEYDANGGTGTESPQTFTYDEEQALSDGSGMSKTGFTLMHWNTAPDGTGTEYDLGQSVKNLSATQDAIVTLYAHCVANMYTVKYDANGGTGPA